MNEVEASSSSPMEEMIRRQIVERGISNERVLDAIRSVPRQRFFAKESAEEAFADRAAPIGHGQTISQPYMVALMTERLELEPTHRVLEIGTGSGYHTAILARLAREVFTMERIKPLLDDAFERLMDLGIRNAHFHYGDGTQGWAEFAPFDRIVIAAGAPELPKDLLKKQLADGGVAVLPVGPAEEQMLVAVRKTSRKLQTTDICPCRFVKLIGEGAWQASDN